jgi:hypothetical protein
MDFQFPLDGTVNRIVFDVLGRHVAELASGGQQAWYYSMKQPIEN